MKPKKLLTTLVFIALVAVLAAGVVFAADDGPLFTRNISRTPETMTGASQMSVFSLYVPAQDTQGEPPDTTLGELEYYVGDCTNQDTSNCTLDYTRPEARPILATYNDGLVHVEEIVRDGVVINTGAGFGDRDAFAALSLDDGATWKNYNLSRFSRSLFLRLQNGRALPRRRLQGYARRGGQQHRGGLDISRFCESRRTALLLAG